MTKQTVTLSPSESTVVSFEVTPSEAGIYHVTVDSLEGSFVAAPAAGRVQGYVIDAVTDMGVPQAQIYVDGEPNTTADLTGGFRTSYMSYGVHIITIYGDGYETTEFEIMLEQSLLERNFFIEPIAEIPGFPDDIAVTSIVIQPPTARLGETVKIGVHLYWTASVRIYPHEISGTITVDGEELTETIVMRFRNPTMWFQYTPESPGIYTVTAKNRSATFEVLEDVVGIFYCPFGCVAPTGDGAWTSKWRLLGSWISLDEPTWYPEYPAGEYCMAVPRFYGGGTGATGYIGTVYCPLCNEAMRTGRTPGDHSYMWRLAEMLFSHIERGHSEVQWDRPPAWLEITGFDIFCIPRARRPKCDFDVWIDGEKVLHDQGGVVIVAPSQHIVNTEGLALREGYPYERVTFERTVSIEDWGDRVTLSVETGQRTFITWQELLAKG